MAVVQPTSNQSPPVANVLINNTQDDRIVQVIWDEDDFAARDSDGNLIVMVVPSLIPRTTDAWEQSLQVFLKETEEVCFYLFIFSVFFSNLNHSQDREVFVQCFHNNNIDKTDVAMPSFPFLFLYRFLLIRTASFTFYQISTRRHGLRGGYGKHDPV